MRVPVTLHPCQGLVFPVFHFSCSFECLFVVLNRISLINNDIGHSFMCLWAFHLFFLVKCLFRSFASLKIGLFAFFIVSWNSWYGLDINILSEICDCILSQSLYIHINSVVWWAEDFNLHKCNLVTLSFVVVCPLPWESSAYSSGIYFVYFIFYEHQLFCFILFIFFELHSSANKNISFF